VNSRVRDVLELMRLDEIISVYDDETAIAALSSPESSDHQAASV
jgi:hypothetical protein